MEQIRDFAHLGTRLYEAITFAAQDATQAGGNVTRLMVIFSDGEPTTKMKPEEAVKAANAEGVQLYPVVLGHERLRQRLNRGGGGGGLGPLGRGNQNPGAQNGNPGQWRAQDLERDMLDFASIGEPTGGRSFDPQVVSSSVIRTILAGIVQKVRAEYVAGYVPASADDGKRVHKVQVKLIAKNKGKLSGGLRSVVH